MAIGVMPTVSVEVNTTLDPYGTFYETMLSMVPLHYWRLNESAGTSLANVMGGFVLNTSGTPTLNQTGLLANESDTCIDMDGTNDRLMQNSSTWVAGGPADYDLFSVFCIIRPDNVSSARQVFGCGDTEMFHISILSSGILRAEFTDTATQADSSFTLSTATTYAILATCSIYTPAGTNNDVVTVQLYINGTHQATTTETGQNTGWLSSIPYTSFGVLNEGATFFSRHFDGKIDECAIFDRIVTEPEAVLLAQAALTPNVSTWVDLTNGSVKRGLSVVTNKGRQTENDVIEPAKLSASLRDHDRALDPLFAGTLYNAVQNSSFETSTGPSHQFGWLGGGTSPALTTVNDGGAGQVGSLVANLAAGSTTTEMLLQTNPAIENALPLPAGQWCYVRANVKKHAGNGSTIKLNLTAWDPEIFSGSVTVIAQQTSPVTGTWYSLAGAFQMPAGKDFVTMYISIEGCNSSTVLRTDAWMISPIALPTDTPVYHDGADSGYSFEGGSIYFQAARTLKSADAPYYPYIKPVRRTRLKCVHNSITYYLFTGDVEDWVSEWEEGRVNNTLLEAVDAFSALSYIRIDDMDRPAELAGARINAILDLAGWPSADRSIATGQYQMQAWTDKDGTAKDLVQSVAKADGGVVFCDGQGRVVFQQYNFRTANAISTKLTNVGPGTTYLPYTKASIRGRADRIKNYIRLEKEGDPATFSIALNGSSITQFRRRRLEETVPLNSAVDIATLAQTTMINNSSFSPSLEAVTLNPMMDNNLFPHVLGREISDRILIRFLPPRSPSAGNPDIFMQCHIEGIQHVINPPNYWETTWRLSKSLTLV